jgi:hypothetical protein
VLVINREVVLPVECVLAATNLAGVSLPDVLAPTPVWRHPQEQQVHLDGIRNTLAGHGLWRGGGLSEPFALTLAVLGRGEREFSATVKTSTGGYRLHVAASGRDAVLACHVPSSGQVVLRPARPEALAEDLFAELPAVGPSSWPGLSVPESDLRQAMNGAPPRRDVRRVMDVAALPRTGSGQISAGFRDGVHRYRKTGANVCTFYDTEQGRYLFSFTEEPGYERYVNVAPGRPETVIAKIYDLLEQLRRRP